jgi:hypothetical protein
MFDPLNMTLLGPGSAYGQSTGDYYGQQPHPAAMPMYSSNPGSYVAPSQFQPPPASAAQQQQQEQREAAARRGIYERHDQEMSTLQDPLSLSLAAPAAAHATKQERSVYDLHKLDADYFRQYEGFHEVVTDKEALFAVVVSALMLFNTVTTTMTVVSAFRQRVNPYNNPSFEALSLVMTFFPLVYLLLLLPVFNNYYSQKVFYFLMERGAVLNFNNTFTTLGYLISNIIPGLFFYSFVGYVILSVVIFFMFGGTAGEILIFVNNAALGFGLYWYRQQSIEDRLVTMPAFVEHFSNFDGEASDIDLTSFNRASDYMKKAVLVQATDPTYSSSFRQWYFNANDYSSLSQIGLVLLHWFFVLLSVGLAFGYFFYMDEQAVKVRWETIISPCVTSCGAGAANITGASLTRNTSWPLVSSATSSFCVCSCYKMLNRRDKATMAGCTDYFVSGLLAGTLVCPPAAVTCPATCTWFPGWNDN